MPDIDAYIQPADASNWLASHVVFIAPWTAATADQKAAALVEASDHIDTLPLKGVRYGVSQTREFPRIPPLEARHAPESEIFFQCGDANYSLIPQAIKDACCLEALEILRQGPSGGRDGLRAQGVKQYSIGGKLSETLTAPETVSGLMSRAASRKLQFWVAHASEAV